MKTNYVSKQSIKYQVLDKHQCREIVNATFRVLERTGCTVRNEEARQLMASAGCWVEGELVKIPPVVMKKAIANAPSELTIYDRFGNFAMKLAPYETYFGPIISNTFTLDVETGEKRRTVKNDAINNALVCDALPHIAWASAAALISDCHPDVADIHETHALLPNTTKPIMIWTHNKENLKDSIEMCEIVAGGADKLSQKPFVMTLACPIDPLVHIFDPMDEIMFLAEKRLPVLYPSGISFGCSGPIFLAGGIVVGLADTLVGLLVSQLKNPGAPFIPCKYNDNTNWKNASISHSRPEFVLANAATADVFRYLELPFSSNLGGSDSPAFDQQAAFDIAMQLYTAALSGTNMTLFIGVLEGANTGCLETLVYGNEVISYLECLIGGVEVSAKTLAEDIIHNVGPGGNFMSDEQTFKHFKEFWNPSILVTQTYDEWVAGGKKDLSCRLNERVKEIIVRGPQNPLSKDIMKQLDVVMARAEARMSGR